MLKFLHRFLLLLPPETAHGLGRDALRCFQFFWFKIFRRKLVPGGPGIHLKTLPSLRFSSRAGVAAGLDKNGQMFAGLAYLGAGFVEIGTVVPRPQTGNPRPRLWRAGREALINHLGFNSQGLGAFRSNVLSYRQHLPVPLFANIGKNRDTPNEKALEDYRQCLSNLESIVDGFVINLSSPNTPDLVQLQNADFLESLAALVPKAKPVWIKFSPDLENDDFKTLCSQIAKTDAFSGVVVTNTSREIAADFFGVEEGGVSGRPLFSRAIECVSLAKECLGDKVVIGVGGIMNIESARMMRRAGADLVEVYTGLVYRGPGLLKQLTQLE